MSPVDTHPHNTTQLQNQSKTIPKPSMLPFIKHKNIFITIHTPNRPQPQKITDRPFLAGKPTRPIQHTQNTKKAITKAISIISTQTLHQTIKLNQTKTHTKNDANRTLASKCTSNGHIITTHN